MNDIRLIAPLDMPPDWPEPPIESYFDDLAESDLKPIEPQPVKLEGVDEIQSLRSRLFDAGYRPVPIYNHDHPVKSPGKQPMGDGWQIEARAETPSCTVMPSAKEAQNTGILCDGLRAVDIDVDDAAIAGRIKSLAFEMFGDAPMRFRANSPRCTLVYRAASGEPEKQKITGAGHSKEEGKSNAIEVLGKGQQFVAYGRHASGVPLQWAAGLLDNPLDSLTALTEADVADFLAAAAGIIGAPTPKPGAGPQDQHEPSAFGPSADPLAHLIHSVV